MATKAPCGFSTGFAQVLKPLSLTSIESITLDTIYANHVVSNTYVGTFTGTVLTGQYGGTGVANTGKTITLGGNLTTTGAFNLSIAVSGNSSVTMPVSGSLMSHTSADSVIGVKKFFGENIYYQAITTVTDTIALTVFGYQTVVADATSSAILITLPNAAFCEGKIFEIKCINADSEVKVVSAGGNIDGTAAATGFTMALWDSKKLISNGTLWLLL